MTQVVACIEGSPLTPAVCDAAAWAARRLAAPLEFLHVLPHVDTPVALDLSGNIGLGSQDMLLDELAELDRRRSKLALEQGRIMLEAASLRAIEAGVPAPGRRQRHGDLVSTLRESEAAIRLLVMGRQGRDGGAAEHVGSHLENVVRTLHRPILVVPGAFTPPQRILIAVDGSATTGRAVERVAASPLFAGLPVHVVGVGDERLQSALDAARNTLVAAGFAVTAARENGGVEEALCAYRTAHAIDLIVMGAYGHSKIREFLVGSTTTRLIRQSKIPLLLLR